ncbi:MAG: hypothetical protein KDC05_16140 [Bacteroidales bacterium]|nr:hypothetical protein [Bacteroidales bacterium]
MKKSIFIGILVLIINIPVILFSQQISPSVISSAGEEYSNGNISLSWTLGELATETLSNGNNTLTQGFQQPFYMAIVGIDLDLLVYLEGPFNGNSMNTALNSKGFIPLLQPFNTAPWDYSGSESLVSVPANMVDWVLIEIRDAETAAEALPSSAVEIRAAILLNDGSVVEPDGSSSLQFSANIYHHPFVVVWHRNHLGVLSATPATESGGIYLYDFSTASTQAYGTDALKIIGGGIYGLYAGDANADGIINNTDNIIYWDQQSGNTGYLEADYNLDGEVQNQDKNDYAHDNAGENSQVPD